MKSQGIEGFVRAETRVGVAGAGYTAAALLLLSALLVAGPAFAQGDPGPNTNIIGLTLDPNDFPDENYRQQNEPSCTIRPDDSACIICAYNDYRLVDLGFDAWQGVSQSCDAGTSWTSRIAPGSPVDQVAPVPVAFAADPRFKHVPGYGNPGLAILNFIGGFRDSDQGVLAIQHWLGVNKEDADFYEPARDTMIIDLGTEGRFIDKPDILPVLATAQDQQPNSLSHVMENQALGVNGTITRSYPDGLLYVGYAVFTGSNSIKVLVKVCDDWGQSCPNQTIKLSEDQNEVSGISLTANKDGSKVLAVWRRRGDNNDVDDILYSVLTKNGNNIKATKGKVLTKVCAFDQPTLDGTETPELPMVAFRTNDFPWAASDGDNFFVFYSDVGQNPDGSCKEFPFPADGQPPRPRIVLQHSGNGTTWSSPVTIDDGTDPEAIEPAHPNSFQFMPAASCANGKCQVAWYDTRREATELAGLPINEVVPYVADHLDAPPDAALGFVQRKVDVYTTNFTITDITGGTIPAAVRVSQFPIEVLEDGSGGYEEFETEASFANKKMFGQGRFSFLGDYIGVDGRQWRKITEGANTGKYESNADFVPGRTEDFFVSWTDNRDVDGEIATLFETLPYNAENADGPESPDADPDSLEMLADNQEGPTTGPPADPSLKSQGLEGGDDSPGACVPNPEPIDNVFERSRDGNIYGSVVKDRVRLTAPTPGKPLGGLLRAFVVALTNEEPSDQTFTLTIDNQPCDSLAVCRASFLQTPSTPTASIPPDLVEELTVPANSTLARTVFIVGAATQPVTVTAREGSAPGGAIVSSVELGNVGGFLDPDVCTTGECSVENAELHNLTLGNLTLGNLTLGNQAILNLTLGNLTLGNLTLGNLTLGNLTLGNLTLGNLTLGNLTLGNLTLGNATLANPTLVALGLDSPELDETSTYEELLLWAFDPANGVNPALIDPALVGLTIDNPDEFLNLTLGNLTLGNLTLGNLTLGNLTLGNLTLGNPAEPNLTLGNLTLGNLTLGNAAIEAPLLNEETCAANTDPVTGDCAVTGLASDDYTFPLTNKGNVTTAIDADITINGDVAATQLITWKANVTATSVNCEGQLILEEQVQAVVNNPDSNLEIANIGDPFAGATTVVAGPGETVFVTYRVFGTPEQLKNVTVSGFTASSQAANCFFDQIAGEFRCEDDLATGREQIFIDGPPTLTIDPAGDQVLEATSLDGAEFTFSATAFDAQDPSPDVTCTSTASTEAPFGVPFQGGIAITDTYALGETTVACSATDNAVPPNTTTRSLTITVQDTSAPEIDPVNPPTGFNPGSPYPFELAPDASEITVIWPVTAFDADANLTFSCTIDGTTIMPDSPPTIVDGQVRATFDYSFPVGNTDVNCTVEDSNGAESTTTFQVSVLDVTPPNKPAAPVENLSAIPADGPGGTIVTWATLFAIDAVDGPIEADCSPASGSLFPVGTTPVSCDATDAAGLTSAQTTFNVTVVDDEAPVITVGGPNPDSVAEDTGPYANRDNATAIDNVDPDVTVQVSGWSGDTAQPGVYTIFYDATDSAGNAAEQKSRQVTVTDESAPVITLNGPDPDSVNEDTAYIDPGATAIDNLDGPVAVTASILDTTEPGTYEITYMAADSAGNAATLTRTVNVLDITPPVITINGDNPDSVAQNTTYTDPGATAVDNVDGTFAATPSPAVLDTSTVGTFPIVYSAVDGAGNAASATRLVEVTDNVPPVVTAPDRLETLDFVDPIDPDYTLISDLERDVTAIDGGLPLPVSCSRDVAQADSMLTDADFNFSDTPYSITCTATDAANNTGSATYQLTVRYLYDVELDALKGRINAGSTQPMDFRYRTWDTGTLVDASAIPVRVSWARMTDNSCTVRDTSMPEESSGLGEDAGNSDFRYTASQDTWQFSWQTPDVLGWHKVTVSPPGGGVADAADCVNLR